MTALDRSADSRQDHPYNHRTGSLESSEPVFLVVGKLRRPHGLRGEMIMEVLTDFPERLRPELQVFIGPDHLQCRIVKSRRHQEMLLLTLEGYTTRESVGNLRNQFVYVRTADIPALPEGEYYHHQLLGMTLLDEHGNRLGKITEIIETGANDVFVVQTQTGPDILIPFLDSLLLKVDLAQRELHTRLLPGLLADDSEVESQGIE
jgi:16S rRNA processing protein RimM